MFDSKKNDFFFLGGGGGYILYLNDKNKDTFSSELLASCHLC